EWFGGLTGEVCVYPARTGGELVLLFHGRELDRVTFASPIGFAAVIDANDVVPAERYRGVVRDAAYARVERAMRAGVLCLVEAIALEMLGGAPPDGFASAKRGDHDARLVRDGLAVARELRLTAARPLSEVPLWPIASGGAATLAQIAAEA